MSAKGVFVLLALAFEVSSIASCPTNQCVTQVPTQVPNLTIQVPQCSTCSTTSAPSPSPVASAASTVIPAGATIIDQTISQTLADTMQLLIVSGLLQSSLGQQKPSASVVAQPQVIVPSLPAQQIILPPVDLYPQAQQIYISPETLSAPQILISSQPSCGNPGQIIYNSPSIYSGIDSSLLPLLSLDGSRGCGTTILDLGASQVIEIPYSSYGQNYVEYYPGQCGLVEAIIEPLPISSCGSAIII